jgi:hypothetical protein
MPHSHRIIITGKTKGPTAYVPPLLIWTPDTGSFVAIPGLLESQAFAVDAWDDDRLLCFRTSDNSRGVPDRHFFLYRPSNRTGEDIDIKNDEYIKFGKNVVRSPDRITVAAADRDNTLSQRLNIRRIGGERLWSIQADEGQEIRNYSFSPTVAAS